MSRYVNTQNTWILMEFHILQVVNRFLWFPIISCLSRPLSFWSTAHPCSEMTLLRHEKAPISFQRKLSLEGSRPLLLLNYWGPRAVRTASFLLSMCC
ncbi:hypothetical protein ALC53_13212 [Atta colombica]|uniref:Uncharacterized protein n=1 Tax=Atta colombica TaxID=520822 RepID=A0A195AVY2_9HYME|nr:hypothetical protein ALC53_13212 [Atta colombica]